MRGRGSIGRMTCITKAQILSANASETNVEVFQIRAGLLKNGDGQAVE